MALKREGASILVVHEDNWGKVFVNGSEVI